MVSDLAQCFKPKPDVERLLSTMKQGNPGDGLYQLRGERPIRGYKATGTVGITGGSLKETGGASYSVGIGTDDTQLKYRERSDQSAVYIEKKMKTPAGTAYGEAGGNYSNGVLGFFINLAFRGDAQLQEWAAGRLKEHPRDNAWEGGEARTTASETGYRATGTRAGTSTARSRRSSVRGQSLTPDTNYVGQERDLAVGGSIDYDTWPKSPPDSD
ncbi:hypothetical protein Purlil1_12697 [Purpureocillium lilacinum]|uniref:Uncharacterized protein n=1 Tax=Purpureocillium lilacinum TaxID=33203 RepID=A0ABR0BGF2_PURLI|nr:hypothetical protein Purlil1_12697 [Purpureocillium lilacinum]